MITRRTIGVLATFDNKSVSLATNDGHFGNEKSVDEPGNTPALISCLKTNHLQFLFYIKDKCFQRNETCDSVVSLTATSRTEMGVKDVIFRFVTLDGWDVPGWPIKHGRCGRRWRWLVLGQIFGVGSHRVTVQ